MQLYFVHDITFGVLFVNVVCAIINLFIVDLVDSYSTKRILSHHSRIYLYGFYREFRFAFELSIGNCVSYPAARMMFMPCHKSQDDAYLALDFGVHNSRSLQMQLVSAKRVWIFLMYMCMFFYCNSYFMHAMPPNGLVYRPLSSNSVTVVMRSLWGVFSFQSCKASSPIWPKNAAMDELIYFRHILYRTKDTMYNKI